MVEETTRLKSNLSYGKTRIPKFRSVAIEQSRSEAPAHLRTLKTKKQSSENESKEVGRRQWQSFDLGRHLSQEIHGSKDALVDDNDNVDVIRASDVHFRRLKEDLADQGTPETLFKMATDLLEGLDKLEADEVRYREEQALFWLMKVCTVCTTCIRMLIFHVVASLTAKLLVN